jgi:hypothetical protein
MTTGGSESIILAIKAYKDRARALKGILEPEAILPVSAHAAHAKGCNYFGVKIVTRARRRQRSRHRVDAVRRLITRNTDRHCRQRARLPAVRRRSDSRARRSRASTTSASTSTPASAATFCHSSSSSATSTCKFDFAVDGVTSISADIHKFGFGPKNASTILYRSRELRKYQFFAYADWSGGIYASPSITGSRAGGSIAAAWATLMALGANGYKTKAIEMHLTLQRLIAGIGAIPHLRVLGPPQACGVSFAVKSDSPVFKRRQGHLQDRRRHGQRAAQLELPAPPESDLLHDSGRRQQALQCRPLPQGSRRIGRRGRGRAVALRRRHGEALRRRRHRAREIDHHRLARSLSRCCLSLKQERRNYFWFVFDVFLLPLLLLFFVLLKVAKQSFPSSPLFFFCRNE